METQTVRDRAGRVGGLLVALGPLLFIGAVVLRGDAPAPSWRWTLAGTVAACAAVTLAGTLLDRAARLAALLATVGLAAWIVGSADVLRESPALTLAVTLVVVALVKAVWSVPRGDSAPRPSSFRTRAAAVGRARMAAYGSLAAWALVVIGRAAEGTPARWAVAASLAVSLAAGTVWAVRRFRAGSRAGLWLVPAVVATAAGIALAWGRWDLALSAGTAVPWAVLLLARHGRSRERETTPLWETVLAQPARLLVLTFLMLTALGTLLLSIPWVASGGERIAPIDAAFTAVSAVCVTGLIVLDTPRAFSGLGQGALLLLIQLGGLGIMTFSTAAFAALGRRMSLRHEGAVAGLLSGEDRGDLNRALRRVLGVTFTAEALGAVMLAGLFARHGDPMPTAAWRGIFTAVSAFCNAGFALQSDNLVSYQTDGWILHTVAGLIVLGGLSPAVVLALPRLFRRRHIDLQTKLVLASTAVLLTGATLAVCAMEWNNTLAGLTFWQRLNNGWFQAVTPRTAGFNSVDVGLFRPATYSLMLALMIIGGSPGGTAGGIKTTTVAVLFLMVVGALRARWRAEAFGRQIGDRTIYKAAAIATVGLATVVVATMALELTQALPMKMALFQVVSALGTVGLSLGGTDLLDTVGKAIVMACMFAGRVGPLTLFLFLADRSAEHPWEYPREEVEVG